MTLPKLLTVYFHGLIKTLFEFFLHLDSSLAAAVQSYGTLVYLLLFFVIFIETGLVVMPFLPGDSLLFISGTLAGAGAMNVFTLFIVLSFAAILGDTVNYWVGRYVGEKIFSKFLKPNYIEKTKQFFDRHGKKAIFLARFVPIVRTFAPFVAGVGNMKYATFLAYNVIGGIAWVGLFVFTGYYFGNFAPVKNNLTLVILLIICISCIPLIREYVKQKKSRH